MTFKLGTVEKHTPKDTGTKLGGVAMTTKTGSDNKRVTTQVCVHTLLGAVLQLTDFTLETLYSATKHLDGKCVQPH